ncbi:MAG: PGF-pre-PGF domain-containing protein [Candidatus Aenigmatarchaeota archaeon]
MEITESNITLDCQGHYIEGAQNGYGIYISLLTSNQSDNVRNVTVKNCRVGHWYDGIFINGHPLNDEFEGNHKIENNILYSNSFGIRVYDASNYNYFTKNIIRGNTYGFCVYRHHTSPKGNLVINGSIDSNGLDFYTNSYFAENYFRNTNFTEPRKFWVDRSWFVYSESPNGVPGLYTYVDFSLSQNITRKIISWDRDLVEFNDTGGTPNVTYYLMWLYPDSWYSVYINNVKILTEKVNASGQTSRFSILMSEGKTYNIKVVRTTEPDTSPPSISISSPPEGSWQISDFQLTYSVTDNVATDKCLLYTRSGSTWTYRGEISCGSSNTTITVGLNKFCSVEGVNECGVRIWSNDTSGNYNSVERNFSIDIFPPTYSLSSVNSTVAGEFTLFSVKWNDTRGLSGYIFSIDNCTLNFYNYSWVSWQTSPLEAWSNITAKINSTVGCTIRWKVFVNDTSNRWNVSLEYSFNTSSKIYCGNGACEEGETCSNCPQDCACPGSPGCCGNSCGCPGGQVCENNVCVTPSQPSPPPECSQDFVVLSEEKNITLIVKCIDKNQIRSFTSSDFLIYNLTLKANVSTYNFIIKVQRINESLIDPNLALNKKVYYYLEFSSENLEEKNLEKITTRFKVKKSWVYFNNINVSTISLYRLKTSWEKLRTYRINEDSSFIYFESELPSFSLFAIAGEEKVSLPTPECPVCPEPSEWSNCTQGKRNRTVYYCGEETNFRCLSYLQEEECEEGEKKKEEGLPILYIILPIIACVFIPSIFIVFYFRKRAKPKEEFILTEEGVFCPRCGTKMEKTYSGRSIEIYECPKCKYSRPELKRSYFKQ